jgi:SAM-dependent methyltransferase
MVCHGELYRLRPGPERLTAFYLSLSLGGALGGLFVAIAAPALFDTLVETPLLAVALGGLLTWLLWSEAPRGMPTRTSASKRAGLAVLVGTVAALAAFVWVRWEQSRESIHVARSFYGAYRVKEGPTLWLDRVRHPLTPGPARLLLSGQTYHGLQFTEPLAARMATTYYCEEGGLGLALREMPAVTNRHLGVLGLGTGTIAAYGRPGDRLRFYEISPEVIRLARSHFRFLADTPAQTEIILGDGRLSLAREADQQFDLLVIDAFTGDAIPTHLLTLEAAQTYRRHLRPDGVLAIHISNNHLNLEPVVRALADELGWQAVLVPPVPVPPTSGKLASIWMLLSGSAQFLNRPAVATLASAPASPSSDRRLLWTDARSSLLPVLR